MSSAQPKVTGTFAKTPLLHVLTSLLEQASTGTLVIETSAGSRSALVVEHGVPTKMRLGLATLRLSEVLVDLGWIRRDAAETSFDKAASLGQLHGGVLVGDGLIDAESLEPALRTQLVKKLQWTAALPADTVFGFYEAADYLSKWRGGKTPVGPLVAMWTLARSRADPAVVAAVINRVAGHPLRLHQKAQPRCFGFDRTELTLLDVLRAKPQTMDALLRMGLVSPHTLERMLYVLTLARHLDFNRGLAPLGVGAVPEREEFLLAPKESLRPSRPVVLSAAMSPTDTLRLGNEDSGEFQRVRPSSADGPVVAALDALGVGSSKKADVSPTAPSVAVTPQPNAPVARTRETPVPAPEHSTGDRTASGERRSSAPPSGTAIAKPTVSPASTLVERRAQIEKLAISIAQLNFFDMLGLPRDATPATVQDTYLKLAKTFHPDRLPSELADLKPLATRIFARMSEAHQTLSDATRRVQYVEQLARGTSNDEEEKIRKVLRAAGAFQKAEVLLKKRMLAAAELEANRAIEDDPDQADYLALYAWIQACKPDSETRLPELCKILSDAVNRNPNSEKNRYYRVQVLKRMGQIERAVADCRIIVEKNPHHVDALREIRLRDMRRSTEKQNTAGASRGTNPQRATGHRPPSDPPNVTSPAGKKSDPPSPPGGLLGRLFKR
jgi:DnaJ-domain-containing protein 1